MAGVKGMKGGGGARKGAGRKPLVTEQQVKEKLQKLLPQALKAIQQGLGESVVYAKLHKVRLDNAWRVINKFAADRKAIEISGDQDRPLGVVILPKLNEPEDEKKGIKRARDTMVSASRPADRSTKED